MKIESHHPHVEITLDSQGNITKIEAHNYPGNSEDTCQGQLATQGLEQALSDRQLIPKIKPSDRTFKDDQPNLTPYSHIYQQNSQFHS